MIRNDEVAIPYSSGNSSNQELYEELKKQDISWSQSLILQGILLTVHILNLDLSIVKYVKILGWGGYDFLS
jgi:hypothetical protein